jgi:hypothetical protein
MMDPAVQHFLKHSGTPYVCTTTVPLSLETRKRILGLYVYWIPTYVRKVYTYARFFALKVYTKVYTFLRDLRSTFRVNYTYSLGPLRKVYTCGVHFPHRT